jgi:hypothetical protein
MAEAKSDEMRRNARTILPKGSDAEDRQAVIDSSVQRNADHVAEDVEPTRPPRGRADENGSEGIQEVGIADFLWPACD